MADQHILLYSPNTECTGAHSIFLYFAFIDLLNSISSSRVGLPLVSSFVVLIKPATFARNNDSKLSLPKIFIAQNVPRKASPAPTVFVTLKHFPTTFPVGIDIISSFFPKIQPFSPLVIITCIFLFLVVSVRHAATGSEIPDSNEHSDAFRTR